LIPNLLKCIIFTISILTFYSFKTFSQILDPKNHWNVLAIWLIGPNVFISKCISIQS
jgi:hypothetical protein